MGAVSPVQKSHVCAQRWGEGSQFCTPPRQKSSEIYAAAFSNDDTFMAPLIMSEALSLASFKDFIDKWAYLWVTDGSL